MRDALPMDGAAIHRVVREAFGGEGEANLVNVLREDGDSVVSLVAEEEGEIVGHVMLSKMVAPFRALALAPVSVTPSRQRSGVGASLVREAIRRAREKDWQAIFVLGDPLYYGRFGFDAKAAKGFASPYAGPHFMMLALVDRPLATTGELRHAPAFAAVG